MLMMLMLVPLLTTPAFAQANSMTLPTEKGTLDVKLSYEDIVLGQETKLKIDFINPKTQKVQEHIDYAVTVSKGDQAIFGPIDLKHTTKGSISIPVEFAEDGAHDVYIEVEGILFQPIPTEAVTFGVMAGDMAPAQNGDGGDNGGCLIATAAYGSELAPQVQQLRELRDGTVLRTESGMAFMAAFNQVYYAFSPAVADLEREQPVFKEVMKVALAPMLSSLSILNHVEIDSEHEMLGYGIPILLLNIGMYAGIPIIGVLKLYQLKRNSPHS